MSEAVHTRGPWMAAAKPSSVVGWPVVAQPHGRLICNMAHVSPSAERSADPDVKAFYAEVEASARLIAAAPDLYAALTQLVSLYETDEGCESLPQIIAARAALFKAQP